VLSGTASLKGDTVSIKGKSIMEIDTGYTFTEYRMYLSASKGDGSKDPDDTIGYTNSAFLSNSLQPGTLKYDKNKVVRNGIKLSTFTPGNTCENDGKDQVFAWGTDKRVHDLKVGGEFGCNFQGGQGTGFKWDMREYTQKTPATSKLRFKAFETGNEVLVGKNLKLWVRGPRKVNCQNADGSSFSKPAASCKQLQSCGKKASKSYFFEGTKRFKAKCDMVARVAVGSRSTQLFLIKPG